MDKKQLLKRIFAVAAPVALQNLIQTGVNLTDTLMIGNISEVQLSGVAQANALYLVFTSVVFGLASGATVLTAQYWGRGEREPIRVITGLIMRICLMVSLIGSVFVICLPEWMMAIFTDDASVIASGAKYLRIVGFSYVFSSFTGVYLFGLRAIGNVRASLVIYGISFAVNVLLNSIFIYGLLGFPRMEIEGAALATLCSRVLESSLVFFYMHKKEREINFRLKYIFAKSRIFWRSMFRYGVPVLMGELNWALGISVQSALIGRLGVATLAAVSFISVVQQFAGIPVIGAGIATSIVMGNMIGEGKEEEVIGVSRWLVKLSLLIGLCFAVLLLIFRPFAPSLINAEPETADMIKQLLIVSAYLSLFSAVSIMTIMGVLRGAGDTAFCAGLDIATLWVLKIIIGSLITFWLKLPPFWIYFILSSDECVKAIITVPRVWKANWLHHTTINVKAQSDAG